MADRSFRRIRQAPKKAPPPTRHAVIRAARAMLYPEAGDPLPPPGSALEAAAQAFVNHIARREQAKADLARKGTGHARPH